MRKILKVLPSDRIAYASVREAEQDAIEAEERAISQFKNAAPGSQARVAAADDLETARLSREAAEEAALELITIVRTEES